MRFIYFLICCLSFQILFGQNFESEGDLNLEERISTIDFVEVLNGNLEEAIFYYENNWKALRKRAVKENYILSYQLLQAPLTDDSTIQLLLITTYANKNQYKLREENFRKLIDSSGGLKLLNNKKPNEFRKVSFNKEQIKHLH